ncbi:MAG: hypothetical protein RBR88_06030 [Candidatus Saccharicenans sp.]|nr:hypothetical protein [Candidatus Saccharicenans sp.]
MNISRLFTQKICEKFNRLLNRAQRPQGSVMMVCILVMVLFLSLGVGLLINSRLFLQVQGLRKISRLISYASENGLKQTWARFYSHAEEIFSEPEIEETLFLEIKEELEAGHLSVIQPLLQAAALSYQDDFSKMSWQTEASGTLDKLFSFDSYVKATFGLNIKSTGQVQGFSGKKSEQISAELTFLAGRLPLNQVPAIASREGLQESTLNQIEVKNFQPESLAGTQVKTVSGKFIPDNALPLISRGLKIFRPEKLPNWLLRPALGLEPGNDPVPVGVYLIQDDLGPGGIYVQGDLDQLLLGVDNEFQVVQFQQEDRCWLLRFDPSAGITFFISQDVQQEFRQLLIPVIMINGEIHSLASGQPSQLGYLLPAENEIAPAFLAGVRLTIVSSGKINLTSNLFSEGLKWAEGLPYLKSQQSQVIIWSTGKDFQSEELVDGGITLANPSIEKGIIEANLVAGGQGLEIASSSKKIELIGSVAATAIDSDKTHLTVFSSPDESSPEQLQPELLVYSERALLHLSQIRILEWRSVQ